MTEYGGVAVMNWTHGFCANSNRVFSNDSCAKVIKKRVPDPPRD